MKTYRKHAKTFDIETEKAICQDYREGLTLSGLSAKYGASGTTHYRILKTYGVPTPRQQLSYDASVFDCIDTELKAYVLGLITADGYIVHDLKRHRYVVQLGSTDKEIPLAFAELINYGRDLYFIPASQCKRRNKDEWRIMVGSKRLVLALIRLNVKPQKSTREIFCEAVPQSLLRHYIRGLCDGDGSLGFYSSQGQRAQARASFLGSKHLLDGIASTLSLHLDVPLKHPHRKDKRLFILSYSGNNLCKSVVSWLYSDCNYYLPRKMSIAEKIKATQARKWINSHHGQPTDILTVNCDFCGAELKRKAQNVHDHVFCNRTCWSRYFNEKRSVMKKPQ